MAGNGQAEVNRRGHGDAGGADLRPGLSVVTGVARELIADSLQAQPGGRIIHRKGTARRGCAPGRIAPLEKAPAQTWSRHRAGETASGGQILPRHQTGFRPHIRQVNGLQAGFDIKISRAQLITELQLIGHSADVASAADHVEITVGQPGLRTRQRRVADVLRREFRRGE